VAYRDEIVDELKKETGVTSPTDSFRQVPLGYYAKTAVADAVAGRPRQGRNRLRRGRHRGGGGRPTDIGGAKFAREIRELREDSSVKAIVLRVNSPGGSATAAETIQRELRLARKVKPVIVSMGSYAASGGYWISIFGDRIFAEPTTITGSIGVFGIQGDIQKLANDHGFTFDSVKTGKFADALLRSPGPRRTRRWLSSRGWSTGSTASSSPRWRRAARLPVSRVEEIAQGRVWSGAEAKKLGLVDEIGGLSDAIRYAGSRRAWGSTSDWSSTRDQRASPRRLPR
jgi:protease-4